MYDDPEILIDLNPSPYPIGGRYEPFVYHGICFNPHFNNQGQVNKFFAVEDNIRLEMFPQTLKIKNSCHKYLKGNNYSDYSLSDVSLTAGELLYNFGLDIRDARLRKVSYALNILVDNPNDIFNGFVSYLTRPFSDMRKGHVKYGVSYTGADFKIKCYNKTLETKLHPPGEIISENILRFEIEVRNLRHLHVRKNPIPVATFRDLYKFENAESLLSDLIMKYRKIYKAPCLSGLNLTTQDLRLLALFAKPEYLEEHKKRFPESYRKDRRKVKEILSCRTGLEIYDEVERKLISKGQELLSG